VAGHSHFILATHHELLHLVRPEEYRSVLVSTTRR